MGRGGAGVSREVEARMSSAGCQLKDALKGMMTRHRGTRYLYNHPHNHTRNLRRFLFLERRFATSKHTSRRTGRVGEGPQQEAQSGRGPHGKEKEEPVGGNGAEGWSGRAYQHKSDATLLMILLRFGSKGGGGWEEGG